MVGFGNDDFDPDTSVVYHGCRLCSSEIWRTDGSAIFKIRR